MTDSMMPMLRRFHDAADDRARARLLLQMPDAVVVKFRDILDAACARAGFQLGTAYLDVRWSEFLNVRDPDGRKTNPLFEQVRADFAAFAGGAPAGGRKGDCPSGLMARPSAASAEGAASEGHQE